jgi:hypothetical protein
MRNLRLGRRERLLEADALDRLFALGELAAQVGVARRALGRGAQVLDSVLELAQRKVGVAAAVVALFLSCL